MSDGDAPQDSEPQEGFDRDRADLPKLDEIERAENVKHLEMIQAIVTRLGSNSFFVKGWTLTVSAAAFGFAVNRVDVRLAIFGSIIVIGFWFLDSYYLRQERLFRHLYNNVRRNISSDPIDRFSMNLVPFENFVAVKRLRVLFSTTLVAFYPVLIAVGLVVALTFASIGGTASSISSPAVTPPSVTAPAPTSAPAPTFAP